MDENHLKTRQLVKQLSSSLSELLDQVYQMQPMFDDDDGTIQKAIDVAQHAETSALQYFKEIGHD